MQKLLTLILIGFFTQLIDGALGMAYGLTTTSFLLMAGISPAVASASVHMAAIATTGAAGISHWRFGNVDKYLVKHLIVPGAIGAFLGSTILSQLPADAVKPFIAGFLFILGLYILVRFLVVEKQGAQAASGLKRRQRTHSRRRLLYPLGLFSGLLDALGGGGWGPLATPVLLSRKHYKPRKVIGSVDTSEFVVTTSASVGFLISLGLEGINFYWVLCIMLGGIVAAPIAAWLVKILPEYVLGILVGGIIIFTNAKTLLNYEILFPASSNDAVYASLITVWIMLVIYTVAKRWEKRRKRKEGK